MSAASRLKFLYFAYASKPKSERALYRAIRKHRMCRIVEFGMTSPGRSRRLIEVAQRYAVSREVCFTGIDLFESASAAPCASTEPRPSLIDVFRTLRPTHASVRLLPGSPGHVLPDVANMLPATDLLLIAHTVTEAELTGAWFYLPRMLHPGSLVLREKSEGQEVAFVPLPLADIQTLADRRRRIAA